MADMEPSSLRFGSLLRRARDGRRLSQLDLALECELSARHLSFLETGRAQPSREMVLRLAAGLMLPLGARNALLQADVGKGKYVYVTLALFRQLPNGVPGAARLLLNLISGTPPGAGRVD